MRNDWMLTAQKRMLAGILGLHIVSGNIGGADLAAQIDKGGGTAMLRTANRQDLTVRTSGVSIILLSASGNKAAVTQGDVGQSNGVMHFVDADLIPKI